jgi:hypothetical protein
VTEETFRIVIDAHVDGGEISGSACSEVGDARPFLGWLGLIAALDGLLECPRPLAEEPAVRVCIAFASADQASAFAASARLRDAVLEAGTVSAPEIWFTHAQSDGSGR